jgi:hypothetical protein
MRLFRLGCLCLLAAGLAFGASPDSIWARCNRLLAEVARSPDPSRRAFNARLKTESDPDVKNFAVIIHDDALRHGAATEMGAHGKNLSWKWLGVANTGDADHPHYAVVGYANPQYFHPPYNEQALRGEIPQIAVGSNLLGEMYVDGAELNKLPPDVREKVLRALKIALQPRLLRVYTAAERPRLARDGTLEAGDAGRSIQVSLVGGRDLNLWSVVRPPAQQAAPSHPDVQAVELDPEHPTIIGRGGKPPYLDPKYSQYMSGAANQGPARPGDDKVSRAHFMLVSDPLGVRVVNGVPDRDGGIRPPGWGTRIQIGDQPRRAMSPKESVLVPKGVTVRVILPNGSVFEFTPQ